jgi:hypothetical protein
MAMASEDRMSAVYAAVPQSLASPWDATGRYRFDRDLLRGLFAAQLAKGGTDVAARGSWAIAMDVWIATELRRAGLAPDAVWPRADVPRTLPQGLSRARSRVKLASDPAIRDIQLRTMEQMERAAGASQTNVLGGYFAKEIDVVIADWDRGLELAVSTKAMTGSFGKNITNRFEEASGDLLNIRRRYPMAAFGYAYLVTSNVFTEPNGFERIKDMLRKLGTLAASGQQPYDATCLVILDPGRRSPSLVEDAVPTDLGPDQFFDRLLAALFARSPVSEHAVARELWGKAQPQQV